MLAEQGNLPLTGERTVPGIARENYWFQRHAAVYEWLIITGLVTGKVVEAGCGEGYGAELLRTAGADVLALDYDESVIDHVRARYPAVSSQVANLDDLPLPDGSAGSVVSLQVIEHLWNLPRFLAECHRVIRPGGVIALSTPNRVTFSPGVGRGEKPTNPFHVEEFDAGQLRDLVRSAGFADVTVFGLRHGARITARESLAGSLVDRQLEAVLTDVGWSDDLLAEVGAVVTADFEIHPVDPESAMTAPDLDLIAIAIKPADPESLA